MADPSLAHLIHQLPGPVVEQNIWKPKRGFSPQTLPEDFLSRAEKPDIRTGALCIGPISLKEAENMGLSRIIMQEDHCCWRLLKYPLIVAQWPDHRLLRVDIARPRDWMLSAVAYEISLIMREWQQSLGRTPAQQDFVARSVYLVEMREVAINVYQPVFCVVRPAQVHMMKREPNPRATLSSSEQWRQCVTRRDH